MDGNSEKIPKWPKQPKWQKWPKMAVDSWKWMEME